MSLRLTGRADFRVGELHALAAWLDVPVSVLTDAHAHQHAPAEAIPA